MSPALGRFTRREKCGDSPVSGAACCGIDAIPLTRRYAGLGQETGLIWKEGEEKQLCAESEIRADGGSPKPVEETA
jgi:hypothetical protein